MKLKIIPLLCVGLTFLLGCKDNPTVTETKDVTVINGRTLKRATITSGPLNDHYVYYFADTDGSQPISVNYRSGKISEVIVLLDGEPISTNYVKKSN